MALPKVALPGNAEVKASRDMIAQLKDYQSKNWGIGLNGTTFSPDGFLRFFTERNLPFQYYVVNYGASIGSPAAYGANINTLEAYIGKIQSSETADCEKVMNEIATYQKNFWGIGLNGDTLQPDNFDKFFAMRDLPFKPFVRSTSGVKIGEQSAYDENIHTLKKYLSEL